MPDQEFYQQHLNRVSRSFAFCIERLPEPLREQVGLSYLLCRILDTVEDADWLTLEEQARQFAQFDLLLRGQVSSRPVPGPVNLLKQTLDSDFMEELPSSTSVTIEKWTSQFPAGLPEGERLLLQDAAKIFSDLHVLQPEVREAIQTPVLSMSRGMAYFMASRQNGELRLRSLKEVNQYCFFVAGVVGEILTRLIKLQVKDLRLSRESLVDAFHFGLFLQKVNLLKDQLTDEISGRFLVPSRDEVLSSLVGHARRSLNYITALPSRMEGFRLFCSWSLFLGLASLPFIQQSWDEKVQVKIPRDQTQELLGEVEKIIHDNEALEKFFEGLLYLAGPDEKLGSVAGKAASDALVLSLYDGLLPAEELSKMLSAEV